MPPASSGGSSAKLVIIIVACVVGGGILLVGLLMAALLPNLARVRLQANRAACLANLNGMGRGIASYMTVNDDRTPLFKMAETDFNSANSAPTLANQTDEDFTSGQWEDALGDQAMQNVWLMIRDWTLDLSNFRCPGDSDYVSREGTDPACKKYGWIAPTNYSYGMHWPYVTDAGGNENSLPLVQSMMTGSTVIMADRNPGGAVGEDGRKPSNHGELGTGCLTFGGSVEMLEPDDSVSRPGSFSRQQYEDDIYINASGVAGGLPESDTDTSIALSGRE
jgi:hypothetical protein